MIPELPQPNPVPTPSAQPEQPLPTPPSSPQRWLPWVIGAVILVIVSATAGAMGYRLLDQQPITTSSPLPEVAVESAPPAAQGEATPSPAVATPSPAPVPPSGFVTYHHTDPSFTFSYPKEWGVVEEQKLLAINKETDQWLDFSKIDPITNLKIATYRPERTIRDLTAPLGAIGYHPTQTMSAEKSRIAQQPDTLLAGQPAIIYEDVYIPGATIGRTYVFYSATDRFEFTGRQTLDALYAKEWTGDVSLSEVVQADMGQDFLSNPRPIAALLNKHPEVQAIRNFFTNLEVVAQSIKL